MAHGVDDRVSAMLGSIVGPQKFVRVRIARQRSGVGLSVSVLVGYALSSSSLSEGPSVLRETPFRPGFTSGSSTRNTTRSSWRTLVAPLSFRATSPPPSIRLYTVARLIPSSAATSSTV